MMDGPVRIFTLTTSVMAVVLILALSGCPQSQQQPAGVLWLQFAQISDTHILDDESPARTVRLADLFSAAWRPQEAFMTQTLDATIRVLNMYHTGALTPQFHLDFLIHTGDTVDNAQYNEYRWFLETMDGGAVVPDSGALDGPERPVPPEDNPKLPFQATGLLPEIPWYLVHGNHDRLCAGNFDFDRYTTDPTQWVAPLLWPVADVIGLHLLDAGLNWLSPTSDASPAIILGNEDLADPVTLQLQWADLKAGPIPADPNRHFINKKDYVNELFTTATLPPGHGFSKTARHLRYSVRPKAGVPVRLIALDTAAPNPPDALPIAYGIMTREQFEQFLKPEVQAAQKAGEWVIVASHHPTIDFDIPYTADTVGQGEFRNFLTAQSNIIAHICGRNRSQHIVGLV